jgi:hypothetical protein
MFYQIYGLRLSSNAPIPGLSPAPVTGARDLAIFLGARPSWWADGDRHQPQSHCADLERDDTGAPAYTLGALNGGTHLRLRYLDGCEFVFDRAGSEIWANWPVAMTIEDMTTYLIGPIMGLILRLRGCVCLHASAIAMDDQVIVLLGAAGAGKSTTAAAFAQQGMPVLTDDIVALDDRSDRFWVQPGDPRIRLWPESVQVLYGSIESFPRLTPTWDKRYLDLRQDGYRFGLKPLPLAAIYVLEERLDTLAAPWIEAVSPRAGLMTLVAHSYANSLLDRTMRAGEFELLGRLIKKVPLRKVRPHADPQKLAGLCRIILDDFRGLDSSSWAGHFLAEAPHV